jgi:signal transduction histidine kinase
MSEEGLKTAMEPFGQVASHITVEGRGTGLGLSIVKALVEAQGGTFHLESQINKGTRAWVEFSSEHLRAHRRAA